jgi:hypothetical protein
MIIKAASVKFGAPPVPPGPIVPSTLTDYACQVVEGRITAAPNVTTVPATFCASKSDIYAPSSFTLELQGLQDWGNAASFSEYLFHNDATQQAFALYLSGATDPSATGICSIAAGDFGGVAGDVLVLKLSLPILGKPTITTTGGQPVTMAADEDTVDLHADDEPAPADEPEPVAV